MPLASGTRVGPYETSRRSARAVWADARSDLFSFGLVPHEMLTGRRAPAPADQSKV